MIFYTSNVFSTDIMKEYSHSELNIEETKGQLIAKLVFKNETEKCICLNEGAGLIEDSSRLTFDAFRIRLKNGKLLSYTGVVVSRDDTPKIRMVKPLEEIYVDVRLDNSYEIMDEIKQAKTIQFVALNVALECEKITVLVSNEVQF